MNRTFYVYGACDTASGLPIPDRQAVAFPGREVEHFAPRLQHPEGMPDL